MALYIWSLLRQRQWEELSREQEAASAGAEGGSEAGAALAQRAQQLEAQWAAEFDALYWQRWAPSAGACVSWTLRALRTMPCAMGCRAGVFRPAGRRALISQPQNVFPRPCRRAGAPWALACSLPSEPPTCVLSRPPCPLPACRRPEAVAAQLGRLGELSLWGLLRLQAFLGLQFADNFQGVRDLHPDFQAGGGSSGWCGMWQLLVWLTVRQLLLVLGLV